jgi:hypothetical protein
MGYDTFHEVIEDPFQVLFVCQDLFEVQGFHERRMADDPAG